MCFLYTRCPNDAPLAEVKRRMAMVGAEVQALNANVSRTVATAADASRQGTAGFTEASSGLVGARASSKGARALLLAAAKSLAGARLSLQAAAEHRKAATQSLSAAVGVAEALRQRLVVACNATAQARNCSSTLQWVPLDSLGPPTAPAYIAALRLEKELAWAHADDIANATANGTLSSESTSGSSSSSGSSSNEARPQIKSSLDMDELRRRREELARGKSAPATAAETLNDADGSLNDNGDSNVEISPVDVEEAAYAAKAARAKLRAEALEAAVSKGPSRLVPHEIWTLCLEQPFTTKNKSVTSSSSSSDVGYNDDANALVEAAPPQQVVVQSDAEAAAAHAVAYQAAAEGCARWRRNETWVCPMAQERLSSWLPRFPVEPALAAAVAALAAGRSALEAAKEGLGSSKRSSGAAQQLLTAAKSGRALSNAALRSAKQQLLVGNSSVNWLRSEGEDSAGKNMEAAKHRSWAMERAAYDLTEGKNREFYDKPCKPVFGACCARDQADGGMNIICG